MSSLLPDRNKDNDTAMPDANTSFQSTTDLESAMPNRPRNLKPTLPFHELFTHLFDPLDANRKKPRGPALRARAKVGPHGPFRRSPQEERRLIIERFIARWRSHVGHDVYPVFRLIVPDKDRERAMYGLKEKAIGKLLVRVMGISRDSEDGFALANWKIPGNSAAARMAGDFAGRCYEVLSKRPMRTEVGSMSVEEVNTKLDALSAAQREAEQLPIFEAFYQRMNSTELMWLIRIILRQMKIGASERTLFQIFHPDAEALFSVTSSLRKVCWALWDPEARLDADDKGIALMQCFQPQLAQFQMATFERMVGKMGPTADDPEFWIEEKLDGERMQMHMVEDASVPGGRRFAFWSRKAKEYTYLYGHGLDDNDASLTCFLGNAFNKGVRNIILDGEMITWDPVTDAMVPFGTLKTAAIEQARNPFASSGHRPLFRIFDILLLNDKPLTNYTLRDRRRSIEKSIKDIPRRFEVHPYHKATSADQIEPLLRKVIAEASEGLVLKNPRSAYQLNERNDDWIKVKPEYMDEFGESLDCIVVGGYYGSGHRGGGLSSFLCGLLIDRQDGGNSEGAASQSASQARGGSNSNPQKTYSFFKVGGGFRAEDYAAIRHATEGKWTPWDPKRPPRDWIELAGGDYQYERPDCWIKPADSVVLQVKAAAVTSSDQFRTQRTLRFPRFTRLRNDRDWTNALTLQEFLDLENRVQQTRRDKEKQKLQVDDSRRKRLKRNDGRKVKIAGGSIDEVAAPYGGPATNIFAGLTFFIMGEASGPPRKTKAELEQLVKANGGTIRQTHDAEPSTICIAERRLVKVASLIKRGEINVVRPKWLLDCISQSEADLGRPAFLVPLEPEHMFFTVTKEIEGIKENVDEHGDSYARDVTADELKQLCASMPELSPSTPANAAKIHQQLEEHGHGLGQLHGWVFENLTVFFDTDVSETGPNKSLDMELARHTAEFGGASIANDLTHGTITHVVSSRPASHLQETRAGLAERARLPRIVHPDWVFDSWREGTRLDEERYAIV